MKIFNLYTNNIDKTKHHSLKMFGLNCWSYYSQNRFTWFRLFGIGLKWKDITIHDLLFSERNGYSKALNIGIWRISLLK